MNVVKRETVLLPVNNRGHMDWGFMANYTKQLYNAKKIAYQNYHEDITKGLSYVEVLPLEEKIWKEFFITELFLKPQRGKRLTKSNQVDGKTPYVSSSGINNGVNNFVSNKENVRRFSNCLTIANSGSVGASFYQPLDFVASDHVTHLKNEKMNKYIYLFIATMTNRLAEKYNFNREINDKRISREKIILPLNEHGKPDYEYMEQYVKNIMINKYKTYSDK